MTFDLLNRIRIKFQTIGDTGKQDCKEENDKGLNEGEKYFGLVRDQR